MKGNLLEHIPKVIKSRVLRIGRTVAGGDHRFTTAAPPLTRMIHERFCCNRRSAAATGLRPAGSPLAPSTYCTSTHRGLMAPRAGLATRLSDLATNRHKSCGLMLLAGMCCVALFCPGLIAPAHSSSSPQTASLSGPTKRWAQFELSQAESMGDPQTGKPITLTIFLGGVTAGMTPVVATCESIAFQVQTVTLEQIGRAHV